MKNNDFQVKGRVLPHADSPIIGAGDLTSKERGSGARYNANKVPVEFIPVRIWAGYMDPGFAVLPVQPDIPLLYALAEVQEGKKDPCELLEYVSTHDLEGAARVFKAVTEREVNPYPAWNWAKGMKWSIPIACIVRHALRQYHGEAIDPETGLEHGFHIACNVVMLVQFGMFYQEGDDRPNAEWFK